MKVLLEIESGYAYYVWYFPGDEEELILAWMSGQNPFIKGFEKFTNAIIKINDLEAINEDASAEADSCCGVAYATLHTKKGYTYTFAEDDDRLPVWVLTYKNGNIDINFWIQHEWEVIEEEKRGPNPDGEPVSIKRILISRDDWLRINKAARILNQATQKENDGLTPDQIIVKTIIDGRSDSSILSVTIPEIIAKALRSSNKKRRNRKRK